MATNSYKGVEYEFVTTHTEILEELQCPICLELVSDPVQTNCGHIFCGKCIKRTKTCPIDRKTFTVTPDEFNKRRLKNFKVKCPNSEKGCYWQGDLGEAEKHTRDVCQFTVVACRNVDCNEEMTRQELDEHMRNLCLQRKYNCPHCHKESTYHNVTTKHFTICKDMPLPCPGGCGTQGLVRKSMEQHLLTECPEEVVPCTTYAIAGCEEVVKRKSLQQHLQEKDQHLAVALSQCTFLLRLVQDRNLSSVTTGNLDDAHVSPPPSFPFRPWLQNTPTCYPRPRWVFKMKGFQEMKEKNEKWFSDPFYTHFGGYKMCLNVVANGCGDAKGTHVSVYVYLMRGDNDDNLQWPARLALNGCLLNQLEDRKHHRVEYCHRQSDIRADTSAHMRVTNGERAGRGMGSSHFISHKDLGYHGDESRFLKDDTIYISVE